VTTETSNFSRFRSDAIQDDYLKLPLVARVALEAAQSLDGDGKLTEAYVQVRSHCLHHQRRAGHSHSFAV
jgi:hypothetical protein